MNKVYEKLNLCLKSIREKTDFKPEIALILGSGLGDYAESIDIKDIVKYSDIEGFPISTVKGHEGRFVFGYVAGKPVVIMQGRIHYYEGYDMSDVVLGTRIMGMLGAKKVILTNAAGGVNKEYKPGDFMIINDHILYSVPNPLIGQNMDELGVRFPDMSNLYNKKMQDLAVKVAKQQGIDIKSGVYVQFSGPSYETPAEVRMARMLGGDAVGMSTACEAVVAGHMGMEVMGISCITNMAAGILDTPLNHAEVQETADRVAKEFKALITGIIEEL